MKNKRQKVIQNILATLGLKVVVAVCGFIVPRMILQAFGSEINGTVSAISSFLGVITLMQGGFDSVAKTAFYKPLAENDKEKLSSVFFAAEAFFKKVALLFAPYCIILSFVFPAFSGNGLGFLFNFSLVLIIGFSSFAQEYLGITYLVLLNADERSYLASISQLICTLLNAIVTVILIRFGVGIHIVKLASTLVFLLRPISIFIIGKRKYRLIKPVNETQDEVLQGKWDNLGMTISSFIHTKTDYILMTVFLSMSDVSIYTVYAMVSDYLIEIMLSISTGFVPRMGLAYSINDNKEFDHWFSIYELINTILTTILFCVASTMIVDFVALYTKGVNDANYYRPIFSFIILIAQAMYVLRFPYNYAIRNAGHFKQIKNGSYVEVAINALISLALVYPLGITGLAIGTLSAMIYRTISLIHYCCKNITHRKTGSSIKRLIINLVGGYFFSFTTYALLQIDVIGWSGWLLKASIVTLSTTLGVIVLNFITYRNTFTSFVSYVKSFFARG